MAHLGHSLYPLGKDDRHLHDLEAQLSSGKFHFDLEGIPCEAYLVEVYRLQHTPPEAYEAGGRIRDAYAGHKVDIYGSTLGDKYPVLRPVYEAAALYIAGADGQVSAAYSALIQTYEVIWIVREVAVHLKDILISTLQGPPETIYISCAQAHLAGALHEVQARKLRLEGLHDVGSAVRRTVVYDQKVKSFRQRKYFSDHPLYISLLIVGGYDYKAV